VTGRPTALGTGAGRGIGAEIARKLASDGWSVANVARSEGALAEVAAQTGALPFVLDVTDAAAVERVVAEVGRVDLLVNNAGTGGVGGATWMKDAAAWWGVMEVNLLGPFLCSRAVLPGMCERGEGRIVFISSVSAHREDVRAGATEHDDVYEPPFPDTEEITWETYGPLKVASERALAEARGARATVVRPHFIVGPHDPTDRFTYWVQRAAAGGRLPSPAPMPRLGARPPAEPFWP